MSHMSIEYSDIKEISEIEVCLINIEKTKG
jgi:hypothetical protein